MFTVTGTGLSTPSQPNVDSIFTLSKEKEQKLEMLKLSEVELLISVGPGISTLYALHKLVSSVIKTEIGKIILL